MSYKDNERMIEKIRVTAVSYANAIPFVQGLLNSPVINKIHLSLDIPSACAKQLINDQTDVGLVPVSAIPEMEYSEIISDFCLSSNNTARTVLLVSEVPLHKIETILLDGDSRTSVILVQVLASRFWKIKPRWEYTRFGMNPDQIHNRKAAVIIGDKAFQVENRYPYQYDLVEEWRKHTGLPFVFATWTANKRLDQGFIKEFNQALFQGIADIHGALNRHYNNETHIQDLENYLTHNIHYMMDEQKKQAMKRFLLYQEELSQAGILKK